MNNVTQHDLNDTLNDDDDREQGIGREVFEAYNCSGNGAIPTKLPGKPTLWGRDADKPLATRVITPYPWGSDNGSRFLKQASVGDPAQASGRRAPGATATNEGGEGGWWWERQQHQQRQQQQDRQGDGGAYDTPVNVVADASILRALQR